MSDYAGRHRPLTRVERRALERRSRFPRSLTPAYAVPTAAAVTLVLTAAGATAAQSSPFTGAAGHSEAALGAPVAGTEMSAAALLDDPELVETARAEIADASVDTSGLATRRQAVSDSVAQGQGRAQERKRAARDKARKDLAEQKAAETKAAETKAAETKTAETKTADQNVTPGQSTTTAVGADSSAVGAQGWAKPLDNAIFTSPFGQRWGRLHAGQDYAAPVGTPLKSMSSGTVVGAGPMTGYGVYIDIKYWDGSVSRYGHLTSVNASVGQQVAPGDVVALSGNTGRSTGPHLHMEIHPGGGAPIDPAGWLASRGIN